MGKVFKLKVTDDKFLQVMKDKTETEIPPPPEGNEIIKYEGDFYQARAKQKFLVDIENIGILRSIVYVVCLVLCRG